jgi:hypothetical protein
VAPTSASAAVAVAADPAAAAEAARKRVLLSPAPESALDLASTAACGNGRFDGPVPTWRDTNGATVTHMAASSGSVDTVRLCLKHGGSMAARDHTGRTPLEYAEAQNRAELIRWWTAYSAAGGVLGRSSGGGATGSAQLSLERVPAVVANLRSMDGQLPMPVPGLTSPARPTVT